MRSRKTCTSQVYPERREGTKGTEGVGSSVRLPVGVSDACIDFDVLVHLGVGSCESGSCRVCWMYIGTDPGAVLFRKGFIFPWPSKPTLSRTLLHPRVSSLKAKEIPTVLPLPRDSTG